MAKVRILDLAKDLGTDVAEVMSAARDCGIVASGPTSMLTPEDREKLSKAVKSGGGKQAGGKSGARTLTLNKPLVAGQTRAGSRSESGGRKVQVEVRRTTRRASPAAPSTPAATPAPAPKPAPKPAAAPSTPAPAASTPTAAAKKPAAAASKPRLSPAQAAAKAVADKREKAAAESAKPTVKPTAKPAAKPTAKPAASSPASSAAGRPAARSAPSAPAGRAQGAAQRGRPAGAGQQGGRSGGPRTTIRRGLTPAQIAAAKAPSSSLKDIEEKIKKERSEQRAQRGSRPANRQGGAQGGSGPASRQAGRAPSVAVAPEAGAAGGPQGAQRRRGPGGQQGSFQRRRLSPAEKAARRAYSEKRHAVRTDEQEDRMARLARGDRRRKMITKEDADFVKRDVEIPESIAVSELASRMAIKGADVVRKLFDMGVAATVNENIDADTALLIVEEFGHTPKLVNAAAVEDVFIDQASEEDDENLQPRPPVVVVMGHVDHGKTSILDALRKARVADGEAGGITQHIGAYMVKLESNERVVFIDTPGHEAFTGLRARGAKLTDVAVLVVAADDGVMPQTMEALNHARAAGVPIIVAVNKMDKEGADPEKVMRQLSEHEVISEEWGGDTIFVKCSAHTGEGLDELLEMLALQTEVLELKANPHLRGRGIVIESRLDKGRGPVATVLVQNGTFNKGDLVVVGTVTGRIRAIVDENAVQHRTAGPSIPFELLGLESVPEAGQEIVVVENDRQAREIISYREEQQRKLGLQQQNRISMDDLFVSAQGGGAKEVNVLIKADVTGSIEAMADSLAKAGTDDVKVKVVHRAIGGITESDIMLASASNAIVIGFNVRPEAKAKKLAEAEGVDVRFYKVIYDAIDDMKAAMAGVLAPEQREKVIGSAEVREVFQVPKVGAVAGCYMTDGFVTRDAAARVLRDGVLINDGKLASLRRFKDDVKEVKSGYECGIGIERFNDIKPGDVFEFYVIEEFAATL